MSQKGPEIRFIAGKYQGKEGWINAEKKETLFMVPVIVDMGSHLKPTFVRKESVSEPHGPPSSYEEAALQQHPDIEVMMNKLTCQLARCNIGAGNDLEAIAKIFCKNLVKAYSRQEAMGHKASWRHVEWKTEDETF